jgi:hypothetical protein
MIVQKSLKIPVHYDTTDSKVSILDNLTARITYGIRLISELITEETEIDRKTIRKLVQNSDIREKYLEKLLKRETSNLLFEDKTSCRYDYRTGNVEVGKGKFSPLWIRISTLEKNKRNCKAKQKI